MMIPPTTYPLGLKIKVRTLKGDFILRPFGHEDVTAYAEMLESNPHPNMHMRLPPFYSAYEPLPPSQRVNGLKDHASRLLKQSPLTSLPLLVWNEANDLLGFQLLTQEELGVWHTDSFLREEARGFGLGKAMRAAVLSFAFTYSSIKMVTSTFVVPNVATESISLALGYKLLTGGTYVDAAGDHWPYKTYGITKELFKRDQGHSLLAITGAPIGMMINWKASDHQS